MYQDVRKQIDQLRIDITSLICKLTTKLLQKYNNKQPLKHQTCVTASTLNTAEIKKLPEEEKLTRVLS